MVNPEIPLRLLNVWPAPVIWAWSRPRPFQATGDAKAAVAPASKAKLAVMRKAVPLKVMCPLLIDLELC